MLSGISLSGPVGEVLAAAAIVVGGYAAIWAVWRVIALFSHEYMENAYDEWTDQDEIDFQEHQRNQNNHF